MAGPKFRLGSMDTQAPLMGGASSSNYRPKGGDKPIGSLLKEYTMTNNKPQGQGTPRCSIRGRGSKASSQRGGGQ